MEAKKKYKRRVIGSVLKDKEGGPDYIKIREDVVLKANSTLKLESPKQQLESLKSAVAAGKLSPEIAETIEERIRKIPDFVRFEILQLTLQ